MTFRKPLILGLCLQLVMGLIAVAARAETPASSAETLKFVVYLSRHGVRSPTGKSEQYSQYSTAPWPAWSVPPGYLTPHGYKLMKIFGAYDRARLASEGLLSASGCGDANRVTIYADSDQRTRETGKALAEGLFPDCPPAVRAKSEGTPDELFHPLEAGPVSASPEQAFTSLASGIGGDPNRLTITYHVNLAQLDDILAKCGASSPSTNKRISILDIPARLSAGGGAHLVEIRGPLNTASTLTENLLLEYTEGMPASSVGWGCINGENLRSLLDLHTAASLIVQRNEEIARSQASNLIDQIRQSIMQSASGTQTPGALARPDDKALILVGHDTNISNVASLLHVNWFLDGRSDDTPPGGALVFELWQSTAPHQYFVRVSYTTQTLEQMRSATALSLENPPARVAVRLPDCRNQVSCSLADFEGVLTKAVNRVRKAEK